MIGHCAKKIVTCEIITLAGDKFSATNLCYAPQEKCPRGDNEGYEKCLTVCFQPAHAEVMALLAAKSDGADVRGATAFIKGIGYSCRNCQEELYRAGIKFITCVE